MPTYSNWTSTTTPISYVPKEKPVYETVGLFTSSTQGIVPPTQNESTNTGQYILAQDGTWIPQPSFSSGGSNAYEILRPSVLGTTYSAYPPTVTNTAYAYDADTNHATTFAEFECVSQTRINAITDTLTYSTFASRAQTWTAATINVSRAYGYFNDGESNDTNGSANRNTSVTIQYSINNGTNWFTLATDISTSIPSTATTSSAALSTTTPTMANILVKLTLFRGGGGQIYDPDTSANLPGSTGDIDLKIYDIWISGTYTSGAGNITCNDLLVTGDATLQNKLYDGSGSAGTAGYILSSTGTKTAWVPDSVGSGTVTSITTTGANGVTISGGSTQTITTLGTFALALGAITPTSIATGTGSFTGDVEFASSIKSPNASNSPVTIAPDGTGDVHLNADSIRIGDNNADATLVTRGTGDLIITTHEGSAVEGIVRLYDGVNGDITLTPNGSGQVKVGTDQVVTLVASQTLTNKTISGSANTLSNIANASLTNSTISGVALGSNLNALTISSPLTGTSYNGSSAVSIGIPVATTSVNGYLSSADWTTFNNKGSGSVTSVAATVPSLLSISGSPITTSGTLAITYSGTALPVANGGTGLTTLTAGYIPYGAGTSAFGSSANLFWDSANSYLGIGTASPGTKLTVNSGSSGADSARFTDGVNSTLLVRHSSGGIASLDAYSTFTLMLGGSEQMRLTSTGLGIGTASPTEKIHISGALRVTGTQTTAGSGIYLDYGSGIGGTNVYGPDNSTQGIWRVYTATANGGTGSEKLRIDSSGNVGIGTATPTYRLHVSAADTSNVVGGSAAAININNSNAAAFSRTMDLNFSVGGGSSSERIAGLSAVYTSYGTSVGGALAFCTNNGSASFAERMRIDSSGNVGIGKAPSDKQLEIYGASSPALRIQNSTTGTGTGDGFLLEVGGTDVLIWNYEAGNTLFGTSGTERMRITSTQVKATVPFIGNSGTKGFGGITTTTSTSTPTGGSSGDHYYIY